MTPITPIHFGLCPAQGICFSTTPLAWEWEEDGATGHSQDMGHVDADTLKGCFNDDVAYHGTINVTEAAKIVAAGYGYSIGSWGNVEDEPLYKALQNENA